MSEIKPVVCKDYEHALNDAINKWFRVTPYIPRTHHNESLIAGGFRLGRCSMSIPDSHRVVNLHFLQDMIALSRQADDPNAEDQIRAIINKEPQK